MLRSVSCFAEEIDEKLAKGEEFFSQPDLTKCVALAPVGCHETTDCCSEFKIGTCDLTCTHPKGWKPGDATVMGECHRLSDEKNPNVSCCSTSSDIPIKITDSSRILVGSKSVCTEGQPLSVIITSNKDVKTNAENFYANWQEDGYYTLYVLWNDKKVDVRGTSSFINKHGHLSGEKKPLMVFYGVMSIIYLLISLVWAFLMAIRSKDLLQLQYWIGFVCVLAMIEMSLSWADLSYWNEDGDGERSMGLLVAAKLLTASKNTLSRLLVLMTAMGLSVVKPRLGDVKKQIAAVGVSSFVLFAIYGIIHESSDDEENKTKIEMLIIIPVSVLDAAVFWWIFFSLHHTMKVLALRQNDVKHSLYRKFQICLAICVVCTIAFTGWDLTLKNSSVDSALSEDWKNEWFREWGFWHLLFLGILSSIMILFRPTHNNNRFAYAVLETELEDDDEYHNTNIPNFGQETMTSRTLAQRGKGGGVKPPKSDIEEELLWVEENIPASVTANDNNFLNFPMDSDEELANTRFETSKME